MWCSAAHSHGRSPVHGATYSRQTTANWARSLSASSNPILANTSMLMPLNKFKQALAQRRTQFGLFLGLANPISAEILATCGYDFLLIDAEHGLNDTRSVQTQLQAMAPYPVQCLVRPAHHDPVLI